jgi:conserved oligomeric Golgi complex subunit 4
LDKESLKIKTSDINDINDKTYFDQSFKLLQESTKKLQQIIDDKYSQAVKSNDIPQMERFFKIFPLIGEAEQGLEKFCSYLCSQINLTADKNFHLMVNSISENANDKRSSIMFADALILLFEKVARVIEAYQPLIETYYGSGNMFIFIKNIQIECDSQALKILEKFKEARRLNYIFKSIQNSMANNYIRVTPISTNASLSANLNNKVNIFFREFNLRVIIDSFKI